ncbi:MAG: amidohydrolase [Chloroflexi bacterium]|nr:amidohydrolase [Chloroflexota bacterium]
MPGSEILKQAHDIHDWVKDIRRKIHEAPELSGQEKNTAALVAEKLKELGIEYRENVGGYGVVGLLAGKAGGRCIALRADMDALSISEQTGLPYASKIPGVMHACGHDAHTAMLLGAARILSMHKDKFGGSVKFIFQPSEETHPGGAVAMIKDGVMENPKPDAVFAIHVFQDIDCGRVSVGTGPILAADDSFTITLTGPGGHASAPHETVDLITLSAHLILLLQSIASRESDPVKPVVITIGKITGGERRNVIASRVVMDGTLRTLDEDLREHVIKRIKTLTEELCATWGAGAEVVFFEGYPVTVNDPAFTETVMISLENLLGRDAVLRTLRPKMAAEDFSYFAKYAPSTMIRLGTRNEEAGCTGPLHSPFFNLDENCLYYGAAIHAKIVLDFLSS